MKFLFDHKLVASFGLWLDHTLMSDGEAFINTNSRLYPISTPNTYGFSVYSSPFKQWVADCSVSGANTISGIYNGNTFIPRGTSGLKIDYNNGMVWLQSGLNLNAATLSGSFAIKELNTYYTIESEETLLFDTKFTSKNVIPQSFTGLAPDEKTFPAIYYRYEPASNKGFAFGGMDETVSYFRCIILADSAFLLDGACALLRDKARTNFRLFEGSELPFDAYGDLKSGNCFDYASFQVTNDPNKQIFIKDVFISKLSEKLNTNVNMKVFGAVAQFDLSIPRHPRLD